jgi:hypothetical protein
MWEQLRKLAEDLQLSQGQLLQIAREITGSDMRTIDLMTWQERCALIAELERLVEYEAAVLV